MRIGWTALLVFSVAVAVYNFTLARRMVAAAESRADRIQSELEQWQGRATRAQLDADLWKLSAQRWRALSEKQLGTEQRLLNHVLELQVHIDDSTTIDVPRALASTRKTP